MADVAQEGAWNVEADGMEVKRNLYLLWPGVHGVKADMWEEEDNVKSPISQRKSMEGEENDTTETLGR